jgi:hypothetical protein
MLGGAAGVRVRWESRRLSVDQKGGSDVSDVWEPAGGMDFWSFSSVAPNPNIFKEMAKTTQRSFLRLTVMLLSVLR